MTQNAIACPGMRIDEFPVHDSGEASFNKSLGVVNLPPRPGRGIVWPFLRPSRQSVAQGFLPGLFAMHDPKTTDERHACVVLKPLPSALQYQVLVESVESLSYCYQVHGTRRDRKILRSRMDPFDIVDAQAPSHEPSFLQHFWFGVHLQQPREPMAPAQAGQDRRSARTSDTTVRIQPLRFADSIITSARSRYAIATPVRIACHRLK